MRGGEMKILSTKKRQRGLERDREEGRDGGSGRAGRRGS